MLRWIKRPLRTMDALTSFVAAMFALLIIYDVAPNSTLDHLLTQAHTDMLWAWAMLIAVVINVIGYLNRFRLFAELGMGTIMLSWFYILWLFTFDGRLLEALPYILFPLVTSIYMRAAIHLDDDWYMH